MTKLRFTKTGIAALPLPARGNQILYADPEQPHHYVRVTAGGARSHIADKNTAQGRVRITLGPAGTDALTASQAREQTQIALGLIAQGYTPTQIRDHLDRSQDRIPTGAMTMQQVLDQLLLERAHKLAARTKSDYQDLLDTHLAEWKHRPMEALENDEDAVIAKFISISSHSRANYSFRVVRLLFNYARSIKRDGKPIVTRNPVDVLSQRKLWHTQKPNRGVINLAALKPWWKAVKKLDEGDNERTSNGRFAKGAPSLSSSADVVRDFLVFLLLTGLRRTEAATLKWDKVDLRSKTFTVLGKNGEWHELPLSDFLHSMIKRRHAAMLKADDQLRDPYVFPGEKGPLGEPKKQIAKVVAASSVAFSSHTLRRTFATIAEGQDIPFLALQRLLNHKPKSVTGEFYTVIDVERLRGPMQKITDFILKTAGERRSAKVSKLKHQTMAA